MRRGTTPVPRDDGPRHVVRGDRGPASWSASATTPARRSCPRYGVARRRRARSSRCGGAWRHGSVIGSRQPRLPASWCRSRCGARTSARAAHTTRARRSRRAARRHRDRLPRHDRVDGPGRSSASRTSFTQMGGEGAQFIGIAPFVEERHFTQNVGDGTFFHSGQLAVQAAVAAGLNMTFKILYNDTIAMTGGQDAQGQLDPSTIAQVQLAQGVAKVAITTEDVKRYRRVALPPGVEVHDRSEIVEVQELLAEGPWSHGADPRPAMRRRAAPSPQARQARRPRPCASSSRDGCARAAATAASSPTASSVQVVDTDLGSKRTIDQTSCNKDYSCLDGDCPSFLTLEPRDTPQAVACPGPAVGHDRGGGVGRRDRPRTSCRCRSRWCRATTSPCDCPASGAPASSRSARCS